MIGRQAISVIIPAYNVGSCLCQCLDSIFAQTYKPTEVIVINDGSTDRTAEVAQSYGGRIKYVEQDNRGQGAARNAGLKVATGRYVAFLDADDYWLPGFLEETATFLRGHPEAAAVSTGFLVNRRRGGRLHGPSGLLEPADLGKSGYILDNFFDTWAKHDHVRTGTVLMRHSIVKRAGPQLEIRISQDLEYWGYLATFGPWGFIPKPLWVGDSYSHAVRVGWIRRYRQRRRACPTIEQWQQRIIQRLSAMDWDSFRMVRGRVASQFAHSLITAGNREGAREIVARYGADMGTGRVARMLRLGASCGPVGWSSACAAIKLREYVKACSMAVSGTRLRLDLSRAEL